MKMNKLLALYPQAQKKSCPASEADILSFAVMMLLFGSKAIHYPNKKLVF